MADLIDKDKLIADIVNTVSSPSNINDNERDNFAKNHLISYLNGKAQRQIEIIDIIEKQLTAGTERHAHWIERRYYCQPYFECSDCNEDFYIEVGTPEENEYNFCPHCGARMDEVMKE